MISSNDSQRTVLITGASRGLGRAMALQLAGRGWRINGCARDEEALKSLGSDLAGAGHQLTPVDVLDESEVASWALKSGPPDLLLNNAALINRSAPLWEVPAEDFDRVIDVNLKGVANVLRHFVPPMIERGSGVIVNFSSGWGRSTSPEVAPYCATKWGIEGLTQALSQELPDGLAAVALNPGIIDTDMLRSSFGDAAGGFPDPDSWAEKTAPFLEKLGPKDNGASVSAP